MIRQVSGILFSAQNSGPKLFIYWTQYDAERDANSSNSVLDHMEEWLRQRVISVQGR